MTFKDEVDAAGERYWKSAYEDRVTDVLDACVEKIDELETRLSNLESFTSMAGVIKITPDPEPQEPFPGYNKLIKEAMPVIMATVEKKKRELDLSEE